MFARHESPTRARPRPPAIALSALVAAALLLTSCGTPAAPQTTVPAGFVAVRNAKDGFAVVVPTDWIQIPLPQNLDTFDKKARALTANNNNLGPAIIQARQLLQFSGKLMAVSQDGMSIINMTGDKTKEKTLEQIAKSTTASLESNGATDVSQANATTGAGPAIQLTFKYPIQGQNDQTVIANEIQYYVLHSHKSYVLTIINGTADLATTVATSFRLR